MGSVISVERCQKKHLNACRKIKYSNREPIMTADNYTICNKCYDKLRFKCVKCNKKMIRRFCTRVKLYLDTQILHGEPHCNSCFVLQGLTSKLQIKNNRYYYTYSSDTGGSCDAGGDAGGGDCGGGDGGSCD
jgi:hypothetical protein